MLERKEIGRRGETYRHLGISIPRDLTCLPTGSLNQPMVRAVSKKKVRDVVIEEGTSTSKPKVTINPPEPNQEHLETKKQLEEIRQRYGEAHWLHSHAGSFVQDLMGLQRSTGSGVLSSTPIGPELSSSPNFPAIFDKTHRGSPNRFNSSESEDYVSALTTMAIVEDIPRHVCHSASESSDQEQKEQLRVPLETRETPVPTGPRSDQVEEKSYDEFVSCEEIKQQEEDGPEDNDDGQLWLVQKSTGNGAMVDLFITLNEKELREKCPNTGRTITKWSLESTKSCEKISNDPPTIHLSFNTIRKTCQERAFIMEFVDAQELLKKIRSFLEARSLSAMNCVAYRCMKCSSMFSLEVQPTLLPTLTALENGVIDNKVVAKCPTCGSTLVVELDEAPLPAGDKSTDSAAPPTTSISTSPLKHSPSDCSIGSAASLEQRLEVEPQNGITKEGTPTPRRYDSDIEVISNPSQSSIEVLEVQARLQGISTPRKRSSEERSTVAVPQLNTVLEVQTNLHGLTESSSSGSLTDSVCTAYESNPVPVRRGGMSDVPEEATPTLTYTSLEGFIQSVISKRTPRNSPSISSPLDNTVPYFYTDFSQVDHRVKFYLYHNTFKDDNEELLFLLRGYVVPLSGRPLSGCVVISTHSLYVLQVIGPEMGDDASDWFETTACHSQSEMLAVFALPWQLGAGFRLGSTVYLLLFHNPSHTSNLFQYINNLKKQGCSALQNIEIVEEHSTKPERSLERVISRSVSASSGPVDSLVRHLALCTSVSVSKDKVEVLKLPMCAVLTTSTELLLLQPDSSWLLSSLDATESVIVAAQKLANVLDDVSLLGLQLKLHFLNENENQEEVWSLGLPSVEAANSVLESIREPWERLFSVPLTLSQEH